MRILLVSVLIAAPGLLDAAPTRSPQQMPAAPAAAKAASTPQFGTFGFEVLGMDRSVRPGDDFYAFANGAWAKNTPIPADKASFGLLGALDDLSKQRVRDIPGEGAERSGQYARPRLCKLSR